MAIQDTDATKRGSHGSIYARWFAARSRTSCPFLRRRRRPPLHLGTSRRKVTSCASSPLTVARAQLLRRRRGLLRFFLVGILALVLLKSHWTPPTNGLFSVIKSVGIPVYMESPTRRFSDQEVSASISKRHAAIQWRRRRSFQRGVSLDI